MKVLVLARYEDQGASSRYRMLQYLPYLKETGFKPTVHSLLDNTYLQGFYSGKSQSIPRIVDAYVKRLAVILKASRYDLIWIEKEAMPFLPGPLERLLLGLNSYYVLDYDDAVFHNYDQHRNPLVRRLLGRKYDTLMREASVVVAGNRYIAERATASGAKRVETLPTVVDVGKYRPVVAYSGSTPVFGWIGTPWTARYLELIRPLFEAGSGNAERRFNAIGSGPLAWNNANVTVMPWTESAEVEDLRRLSVGVMPLVDSAFERGKCGLKLLQYMAVGLPVIASPVGVNVDIVEHGVNGFLCSTAEEWEHAIRALEGDPSLRECMGRAGRKKVESSYSLEGAAPQLAEILNTAAANGRKDMKKVRGEGEG